MLTAIRKWVLKTMMKNNTGVVQTLPKRDLIELNVQITAERLARNGINPEALKTVDQVENIIKKIEEPRVIPATSTEGRGITEALFGKRGEVFDMKGNKLDTNKSIMGGTQETDNLKAQVDKAVEKNKNSKNFFEDRKSRELIEEEIKAKILASNKKNVENIKNNRMLDEDEIAELDLDIGGLEYTNDFDGTVGSANKLRKERAEYIADMELEYKKGNLETNNFALNTITKIKSMKPMDAMKEANLVAGKKGRYSNLDDNQVKKIIDDTNDHIFERDIPVDPEDMATGGRAGFKLGTGEKFLKFLKKFKVKQSGDGVNEFLSKRQFIKNIVGNTEKNRKARQLAEIKEAMENTKGYEFPSGEELRKDIEKTIGPILLKDRKLNATGGRAGFDNGSKLTDFLDVQASGSKSGKQQIKGAPEGITMDNESINAIIKADIPISQKIDLLAKYQYGKGRTRIERDGQEIFMDEGGYKDRDIGFGYNLDGEGISGSVMRDLRTGDDDFKIKFSKKFAEGGRIGYKVGSVDKMRRLILKAIGAGTVGIGAAKSGIFSGLGKGATKQAAKEVVQKSTTTPPPYFFKLVEKIKTLGDDTLASQDKAKAYKYKDYVLEEDFAGNIEIIKKQSLTDNPYPQDVYMSLKVDEVPLKGKKGSTKVQEYEEYTARPDGDGKMKDVDDGVPDEVIEEGTMFEDNITDFGKTKKAGGGIARMLGE